jgi:hypothetical protein
MDEAEIRNINTEYHLEISLGHIHSIGQRCAEIGGA